MAEQKVQEQARRLVEQGQQLIAALQYGQLCERLIRQLSPSQPLPLTLESLETAPVTADASAEVARQRERAERAEAACLELRAKASAAAAPPTGAAALRPIARGAAWEAAASPVAASLPAPREAEGTRRSRM